jgi:uncharacterized repeat protein (TIGR01451 family)
MPIRIVCRLVVSWALLSSPFFVYAQSPASPAPAQDTLRRMAEEERRRLMDPATGTVPYERLDAARRQLNNRSVPANGARVAQSGIPNITWQERGPSNVGGRTRALLFAPNDPAHKKVWAGSPAGGLWYTNDITDANAGWTPVSDNWENTIVTALAADPSNPQVMYAGTGDAYNYVLGGGIWKTTNGGTSWTRLSSTIPTNSYPTISYSFGFIQRIVVNSSGEVFAATRLGVVRSTDGGTTWQYALAPNQFIGVTGATGNFDNDLVTDLELGTDGIVYAGFNPSRVFKSTSTTGTSWFEISPVGSSGGERTELALAPSTSGDSQVIYGVSRAYNSVSDSQDIKWFKKSTNGGSTWTDVQIPTFSWGSHFTNGNGYGALNLAVHPTDANTVYAGGYDWFRSVDGGTSWRGPLVNSFLNYQTLVFQPGNAQSAVLCSDKGVLWSSNWNDASLTQPTVLDKNNGYRVNETNSVAMKSSPGSAYVLGTSRSGAFKLMADGLSAGAVFYTNPYDMGLTFIDDDTPASQVFLTSGSVYLYNGINYQFITGLNSTGGVADYNSPLNTLYVADYNYATSQCFIRKVTGIGSSILTTVIPLTGVTNSLSYLKLSKDRTALFAGNYPGKLYKITNLDQANPTITIIDNGAFPLYTFISGIDVGASDNELLVTLSNFGVQSVWYTNDGGQSWAGKDQSNYGLADVPVRAALFNPQNRKQVLLGTDAGIWSTTDITAANPGWTFSGTGMGAFRVNQLKYRASDGRIAAATYGRGVFTSDAFAIPYTLPTIVITATSNATLCVGNTFTVSFSTAGPSFTAGNTFDVWLSDATGNFTNAQKIGSGTASPVSATIPSGYNAVPYGTKYRVKIVSANPEVESSPGGFLTIGNLTYISLNDRRIEAGLSYNNGFICAGGSAKLVPTQGNGYAMTGDASYQWFLNDNLIPDATASTHIARQAGNYTVAAKQGGCTVTSSTYPLNIYPVSSSDVLSPTRSAPQCADHPITITSDYIGETASFQWTRNGATITGATSYSYTTNLSGSYAVTITDGSCAINSSAAYLQFAQSLFANAYPSSPGDTLVCTASNFGVYLYPTLPFSANDYSLKWYRNGVLINTATTATSNSSIYAFQPGIYSFTLKQGACQTVSNAVTITDASPLVVKINYDSNTKSFCPGESRYLYANINGGTFQWQKDGIDITGATNSGYTATVSGSYTVRLTRGTCSATSPPVSLTFSNAIQPKLSSGSYTKTACSFIAITSEYYNLGGYQYQWYKNGTLVSTTTNSYYYPSQSGNYSLRVTNGSCTGLSKEVYVNVNNEQTDKPRITSSANRQLCANNSLLLTASYYTGTLQWKRNGIAIDGATNYQFYATQSGIYTVVLQDGSCSAESDPVEVKIGEATTATLSGNALITAGQSTKLPIAFTGPAPWSVSLTNGQSLTATYQNPAFITVAPTANTTYQLAAVINACGTGTTSGQASVSVGTGSADVSLNMVVSNRSPKVGDVVSYTLSATNAGPDNTTGVQLSSLLPAGLSFVSSDSPGFGAANGMIFAVLGTIPANGQKSIRFLASPTLPGTFVTSAQLTVSQTPDPDSQPNSGTGDGQDDAVSVDLRTIASGSLVSSPNPSQVPLPRVSPNQPATDPNSADLSLNLQVDKLSALTSDVLSTSVTVSNRGGAPASSVVVEVVLPNGAATPTSQVGWVLVSGQIYKGYINQLGAGQSATLVLKWQATGSGTLKAQVLDLYEMDSDSTPGNGYSKGEDDEATLSVRVR